MQIEICASTYKSLELAAKYKVNRVELCQNLRCGGLTPSLALVKKALGLGLKTHVLIRPRAGDFFYSRSECQQIMDEVNCYKSLGIDGLVVGALTTNRKLAIPLLKRIRQNTIGLELTFHKAFDDIFDWKDAMDDLVKLKFDNILTSGQSPNVIEGLENLKDHFNYANGRIKIMPGGGVTKENIKRILSTLPTDNIHFSATKQVEKNNSVFFSSSILDTDTKTLKEMVALAKG